MQTYGNFCAIKKRVFSIVDKQQNKFFNPKTFCFRLCYPKTNKSFKMKKINLFTLALASVMAFTSCSDNNTTGSNNSADSSNANNIASDSTNTASTTQEQGVMVGGANMVPSKNIVENAANSNDHTTLVAAVKAAGLAEH